MISTVNSVCLIDGPLFPSKVTSKCPAIMFVVRRTTSVPGQIKLPFVSVITVNGINMVGVPWGTNCSNMWLVFLIHLNNMNLIHKGSAKVSVRLLCCKKSGHVVWQMCSHFR
jgi:hypothetical protein